MKREVLCFDGIPLKIRVVVVGIKLLGLSNLRDPKKHTAKQQSQESSHDCFPFPQERRVSVIISMDSINCNDAVSTRNLR